MKFNRILLVVVSLALMVFALQAVEKMQPKIVRKIKCRSYYYNVNGFSKRNRR